MTRPTDEEVAVLWATARDSWDDTDPMCKALRRAAQWVEDERERADAAEQARDAFKRLLAENAERLAAARTLAERWASAVDLMSGQPHLVSQAFADALHTALDGGNER